MSRWFEKFSQMQHVQISRTAHRIGQDGPRLHIHGACSLYNRKRVTRASDEEGTLDRVSIASSTHRRSCVRRSSEEDLSSFSRVKSWSIEADLNASGKSRAATSRDRTLQHVLRDLESRRVTRNLVSLAVKVGDAVEQWGISVMGNRRVRDTPSRRHVFAMRAHALY